MSARIITGTTPEVEHKTFTHVVLNDYVATAEAERKVLEWIHQSKNIPAEAGRTVTQDADLRSEIWRWEWWEITL
jgi:hypothetical protein